MTLPLYPSISIGSSYTAQFSRGSLDKTSFSVLYIISNINILVMFLTANQPDIRPPNMWPRQQDEYWISGESQENILILDTGYLAIYPVGYRVSGLIIVSHAQYFFVFNKVVRKTGNTVELLRQPKAKHTLALK